MSEPWTPGPWTLWVEGKGIGGAVPRSLGREIPDTWGMFREPPQSWEDETTVYATIPASFTQADARLIEAATEMAELLVQVAGEHSNLCPRSNGSDFPEDCECIAGFADSLLSRIRGEA